MIAVNATTFTNPLGFEIRVVEIQGEPWFVAADVCRALGLDLLAGVHQHIAKLADDEKTRNRVTGMRGGQANLISESGLYKLVLRSDKAEAKVFQDWVTRDVLPAIRKDGAYVMGEEKVKTGEMSEDELVLKALTVLQAKVARLTQERDEAIQETQFVTVDEYRALTHRYMGHGQKVRLGQVAAQLARSRGLTLNRQTRTVPDRYSSTGVREVAIYEYPRDILVEAEKRLATAYA